jgi:hypothetical protein
MFSYILTLSDNILSSGCLLIQLTKLNGPCISFLWVFSKKTKTEQRRSGSTKYNLNRVLFWINFEENYVLLGFAHSKRSSKYAIQFGALSLLLSFPNSADSDYQFPNLPGDTNSISVVCTPFFFCGCVYPFLSFFLSLFSLLGYLFDGWL